MNFVKAKEGPANYGSKSYTVQYFDKEGNMTIRSGGTKAWRNNNPGNLVYSQRGFAVRHGAIGKAAGMAVFPNEAVGRKALTELLKSSNYNGLKISEFSDKYDKDNSREYRRMLLSISKLDPDKYIRDLSSKEFDQLRTAIERIEGWEIGQENVIEKWYITGVHRQHGVIFEYLIKRDGREVWTVKEKAMALAREGRLHAIVVHLKGGTEYLRPEYGNRPFTKIV